MPTYVQAPDGRIIPFPNRSRDRTIAAILGRDPATPAARAALWSPPPAPPEPWRPDFDLSTAPRKARVATPVSGLSYRPRSDEIMQGGPKTAADIFDMQLTSAKPVNGAGLPATPGSGQDDGLAHYRDLMIAKEGRKNRVYRDSLGFPTVGIGHRVQPQDGLGMGDVISDARIDQLFSQDATASLAAARAQAAEAGIADADFINPLASVNFQMPDWTRKFYETWPLIKSGAYAEAADRLDQSRWKQQTPKRVVDFQSALRALPPKPTP